MAGGSGGIGSALGLGGFVGDVLDKTNALSWMGVGKKAKQFGGAGAGDLGPDPQLAAFDSKIDPTTGLLKPQYQVQAGDATKALESRALAPGQSMWANQATGIQGQEQAGQRNTLEQQQASKQAQAMSSLASRGGLSQGASERMAQQMARGGMAGVQNLEAQGALDRAKINLQDEEMKQGMLKGLSSAEQERQKLNIGQSLNEIANQRDYNKFDYSEKKKQYAAAQSSKALAGQQMGGKFG
jgi:hypothetical protein